MRRCARFDSWDRLQVRQLEVELEKAQVHLVELEQQVEPPGLLFAVCNS